MITAPGAFSLRLTSQRLEGVRQRANHTIGYFSVADSRSPLRQISAR